MHADCRTQIKCKDCGQMFSTTSSLNKHRRFCEGKNHYTPGGMFSSGIPLSSSPIMPKAKMHPGLNHAGLNFGDYFPSRAHHGGLSFSQTAPAFSALAHGFPGIFPSLYPRPPLLPPSSLLKHMGGHHHDGKLPRSPLDGPPLSLVNSLSNSAGNGAADNNGEERGEGKHELAFEAKGKSKLSDASDASDLEDVNTTSGTDLDTTTGENTASGSELDSDAEESEREREKRERRRQQRQQQQQEAEQRAAGGGGGAKQDDLSNSSLAVPGCML